MMQLWKNVKTFFKSQNVVKYLPNYERFVYIASYVLYQQEVIAFKERTNGLLICLKKKNRSISDIFYMSVFCLCGKILFHNHYLNK